MAEIHSKPGAAIKMKILDLFLHGNSINHIVFILDYKYRIDDVTEVIRIKLQNLLYQVQGMLARQGQKKDRDDC